MNLKRGINLGGFLSQCYHCYEHYDSFIQEEDIQTIASWGLDHVRLPIDYMVLEEENGETKERGFEYVTKVVEWTKKAGINVILDLHKAYGYDFNFAGDMSKNSLFTNEALQARFVGLWEKIASRYAGYDHVAFELLNEVVESEVAERWNDLIDRAVTAIRKYAKDTPIIYGGIQWNNTRTVKLLRKPMDKNIIFTFHFYEPLLFTHQKASWVEAIKNCDEISYPESMDYYKKQSEILGYQGAIGSNLDMMGPEFFRRSVKEAVDAANKAGVEIYCGEFGVIDQAPVEDTLRWYQDVDAVFREYNIGCAAWSYKRMNFGLIDEHYDPIREQILATWTRK